MLKKYLVRKICRGLALGTQRWVRLSGDRMDGVITRPAGRPTVAAVTVARYCLAIAAAATAVIHFAAAGEHFAEYWLFGAFMLVTAWLQAAWSVGVVVRPWLWLPWGGAALNAGIIAVYIVTR